MNAPFNTAALPRIEKWLSFTSVLPDGNLPILECTRELLEAIAQMLHVSGIKLRRRS